LHGEEAGPFDRDVERVARLLDRALLEGTRRRDDARASTDLHTTRALRAWRADRLVVQVLEQRVLSLVADGIRVREVVRDRVELGLLRGHPGRRDVE
jgi:hypothetical protein